MNILGRVCLSRIRPLLPFQDFFSVNKSYYHEELISFFARCLSLLLNLPSSVVFQTASNIQISPENKNYAARGRQHKRPGVKVPDDKTRVKAMEFNA